MAARRRDYRNAFVPAFQTPYDVGDHCDYGRALVMRRGPLRSLSLLGLRLVAVGLKARAKGSTSAFDCVARSNEHSAGSLPKPCDRVAFRSFAGRYRGKARVAVTKIVQPDTLQARAGAGEHPGTG